MATSILCMVCLLVALSGCTRYSKVVQQPMSAVTATAEQKTLQKTLRSASQPIARLGLLLHAADAARLRLAANPSSTTAQSDYNFAVSRIVELIEKQNLAERVAPVVCPSEGGNQWSFSIKSPVTHKEVHLSDFHLMPADRYTFKGKLVGSRKIKRGLGAPIIVVGKDMDFTKVDRFAQGKQIFYGMTAVIRFQGRKCEFSLIDPLDEESVPLDGHSYPLAADFQAPLALALAELNMEKKELGGMFKPDQYIESARLARLQPYNPNKIPVLFIHGLGNSPATWVPLIDFLRGDEEIRKHYQFWFFSYPSGLPYPISAAILRSQLDEIRQHHPDHKDLVVLGHSMGGMISRLLITDSGMTIWDAAYDKPPEELSIQEETRRLLKDALIFKARPDISRVIYASASHRGSDDATSFLGRLGSRVIGNPVAKDNINEEAIASARPDSRLKTRRHLPNSIDVLDPDNLFHRTVDTLPSKPGIPFHSIIGDRGKGGNLDRTKPVSSDGIVPYWSSHIEGAESELIIPSEHWSILHPLGMAEIKRILIHNVGGR
jgi:pimeloyl-ACP methyl ester carboxylesterase